jgi:DNA-binding NtrC family response regulator
MKQPSPPPTQSPVPNPLEQLPDWFLDREVIPLEDHLALVVSHETMRGIVALCRDIAENPAPVLLTGETGVGKSLLARFLHASRDPFAPFVSLLALGLGEAVLSGRLFGPAANAQEPPLTQEALGGTLVLEEMGDMPPAVQKRLLEFWDRAGDGPSLWICTTNAPPDALLPEFLARFRRIEVPPLRERKADIPALVAYFSRLQASRQASLKGLENLAARLAGHPFPGNVRELESLMALEAGGLPWRWRVTGAEKDCVLAPQAPRKKAKAADRSAKTKK